MVEVKLETAIPRRHDLADLIAISLFAIGCKTHDFAFIAVLAVADELANHGVNAAQRVRKEDAVENFNLIAFATSHHRRNKIAGSIVAEAGSFLPRGTIIGARDVRSEEHTSELQSPM